MSSCCWVSIFGSQRGSAPTSRKRDRLRPIGMVCTLFPMQSPLETKINVVAPTLPERLLSRTVSAHSRSSCPRVEGSVPLKQLHLKKHIISTATRGDGNRSNDSYSHCGQGKVSNSVEDRTREEDAVALTEGTSNPSATLTSICHHCSMFCVLRAASITPQPSIITSYLFSSDTTAGTFSALLKKTQTCSCSTSRRVKFPSDAGTVPSKVFPSSRRVSRSRSLPNSSPLIPSSLPDRPHREADSTRRATQFPMSRGIFPSSLLWDRSSVSSEVSSPTSTGTRPVNLLCERFA